MDKEVLGKLRYYINKKRSVDEIALELGLERYQVYGLVQELIQAGYLYDIIDGEIVKLKKPIETTKTYCIPNDLEKIRLLLISDTHLCNKADRLDILNYLYDRACGENVKAVLHCGDIADGNYTNRPQQIYELRCHGFDEHLQYVVEKYPKTELKTYFVGGNHLDTYIRNGGSDMGKAISKVRDDLVYLNPDTADLSIGKLNIHLHHGGGGKPYSYSYKLQRYVETLPQDKKIDMVLQGHFHNAMYMYYMSKHCFQVGALVDETSFSRSMGFKNEKSCYWVDIEFDNKGNVHSISPTLETFETKKLIRKR